MTISIENMQEDVEVAGDMSNILDRAVKLSLSAAGLDIDAEVNFLLADNEKMREINFQCRGVDKPTDVLSFPMVEKSEGRLKPQPWDFCMDSGRLLLGDVAISMETAKKQAAEYGHSFEREFAFLAVHGIFHLLGYDHDTEENERAMFENQEIVLRQLGLKRGAKDE